MVEDSTEQNPIDRFEKLSSHSYHEESDRKRGVLTKRDREYLLGETEIDGQDERNLRYRMRQRITQGILDLALCGEKLPRQEYDAIADNLDSQDGVIFYSVHKAVSKWYYFWIRSWSPRTESDVEGTPNDWLEGLLAYSITEWEENSAEERIAHVDVNIDVSTDQLDLSYIKSKIEEKPLKHKELMGFIKSGDSGELLDFIDFVRQKGSVPVTDRGIDGEYEVSAEDVITAMQASRNLP